MRVKKQKIYMDFASSTPISKRVLVKMRSVENIYKNPASLYASAIIPKNLIHEARNNVAKILSSKSDEIVFTSGGTESNNLAILGLFQGIMKSDLKRLNIITSSIEHSSVLESVRELERRGVEVIYLRPNRQGKIESKQIGKHINKNTFLVSIMYANNEIGTIQPIKEISKIVKEHRKNGGQTFFHTDASQAPNYLDINVQSLGIDLMTLDGGKIYGPKGVGALYIKKNTPIKPIIFGGGQEMKLRSGTENLSLILGFVEALSETQKMKASESLRLIKLREYFIKGIHKINSKIKINGDINERLPNNINVCIPGIDAEFAVFKLDNLGIECSSASACLNLKDDPYSYVIKELYRDTKEKCAGSSLRFSMGRATKKNDIDNCLKALFMILSQSKDGQS